MVEHGSTRIKSLQIEQYTCRLIDLSHDLESFGFWGLHTKNTKYLLNLVMLDHIVVHLIGLKLVHDQLDISRIGRRFLSTEVGSRESIGDDVDTDKG